MLQVTSEGALQPADITTLTLDTPYPLRYLCRRHPREVKFIPFENITWEQSSNR